MPDEKLPPLNDLKPKRAGRRAPSTAFKPGNEYRFKSGESGNKSGRPRSSSRLIRQSLIDSLGHRADDAMCQALNLPLGSSLAMCYSKSILIRGIRGDASFARLVADLAGALNNGRPGFDPDGEEGAGHGGPTLIVQFRSTEFQEAAAQQGIPSARPEILPPLLREGE